MKWFSKVVSVFVFIGAVAYLASSLLIIFDENVRNNPDSYAVALINLGCILVPYATYLLLLLFLWSGLEVALSIRSRRAEGEGFSTSEAWKQFLSGHKDSTSINHLLSSLFRLTFFLLCVSQLSWYLDYC